MANLQSDSIHIREVWTDNLEQEFALIREIVNNYRNIAMDTEFPGIILRPLGNFKTNSDYHYQILKANVDKMKLIQLGLTFSDEAGNLPTCGTDKYCVWQFNFREFNVGEDASANDSIELLRQSGIDFKNNENGIDVRKFGELLMSSGIVLNDDVHFVSFHGRYDFGYLIKILMGKNLPDTQTEFFKLVKIFFPTFYDIKHMMKMFCDGLHGRLDKLAELLGVQRIGNCGQAGSESLLTSATFKKMKESFFHGSADKYVGVFYGLSIENYQNTH